MRGILSHIDRSMGVSTLTRTLTPLAMLVCARGACESFVLKLKINILQSTELAKPNQSYVLVCLFC